MKRNSSRCSETRSGRVGVSSAVAGVLAGHAGIREDIDFETNDRGRSNASGEDAGGGRRDAYPTRRTVMQYHRPAGSRDAVDFISIARSGRVGVSPAVAASSPATPAYAR